MTTPLLKLGLKPVQPRISDFMFTRYRTGAPLPPHPPMYGNETKIYAGGWRMLANDRRGCCVFAGSAHEHMLWNATWGRSVSFTDESVLADYAAVTGFDPKQDQPDGSNPTDQGTDVHEALKYRQDIGIQDADGNRHKIGAYVFLTPGNYEQYLEAQYLFDSVAICLKMPASAMDQFNAGKTWTPTIFNREIVGQHYVPGVALRANPIVVTWGKTQMLSPRFYKENNVTSVAIISPEQLDKPSGKNAQAFDYATLSRDLTLL